MTHHLPPIRWLLDHGLVPELLWHLDEAQRGEETVRLFKHFLGCPALGKEQRPGEGQWGMLGCRGCGMMGGQGVALFWARGSLGDS